MMIIDNFMYYNDDELLELRYHVLKDVVDMFVISEANHTFSGIPKPFKSKKLVQKLGLNLNKFIFLEVDTSDQFLSVEPIDISMAKDVNNPDKAIVYSRQRRQRDAISSIVDSFSDDTIFILGDCDEIPKPDAVKYLAQVSSNNPNNILKVPLILLESRADRRVYDENNKPVEWRRSQCFVTKKQLVDKGPTVLRAEYESKGGRFKYHPIGITENGKLVEDLGWHFTWMGNKEKRLEKAKSCAHSIALGLVDNISDETKKELSFELKQEVAKTTNYHLEPFDTTLLPVEIFHYPNIRDFLLPEIKINIVDYFMYFNEKELLELRYHMLKDVVDLFVVSESNMTFAGNKKRYNLENVIKELNLDRRKFRILHCDLTNLTEAEIDFQDLEGSKRANDSNVMAWTRERAQRDAIQTIVHEFSDDCTFIISDIDEIVKPDSLPYLMPLTKNFSNVLIKVPLVLLESRADKRMVKEDGSVVLWDRSMFLATKKHLLKYPANTLRAENQKEFPTVYITENNNRVEDLGWHFTWMGDKNRQQTKAKNYGHAGNLSVVNTLSKDTSKTLATALGTDIELKNSYHLVDYDLAKLPQEIFNLPNVKRFLLPDTNVVDDSKFNTKKLLNFIDDPNSAVVNFELGYEYEINKQIAAAVSYYLRSAERTEEIDLQYECFLRLAKCFQFQQNRNFTVTGLYTRAITLDPKKTEAYYLLAKHYLDTKDYQNAYLYSTIGINLVDKSSTFKTPIDLVDKFDLEYVRAISGWYVGFYEQSKDWLRICKNTNIKNGIYNTSIDEFFTDVIKEKC